MPYSIDWQIIWNVITFANSLGQDQARQNVEADLDQNCLRLMVFCKKFSKKMILKKELHVSDTHKRLCIML